MNNPMCDGSGPCSPGEVRVLPIGSIPDHGNMILCSQCFWREIVWRTARNRELSKDCAFKLPQWADCAVYGAGFQRQPSRGSEGNAMITPTDLAAALKCAQETLANARQQLGSARLNITSEIRQWEQSVTYWQSEVERLKGGAK